MNLNRQELSHLPASECFLRPLIKPEGIITESECITVFFQGLHFKDHWSGLHGLTSHRP